MGWSHLAILLSLEVSGQKNAKRYLDMGWVTFGHTSSCEHVIIYLATSIGYLKRKSKKRIKGGKMSVGGWGKKNAWSEIKVTPIQKEIFGKKKRRKESAG